MTRRKLLFLITPIKSGSHFAKMFLQCSDRIGYNVNEAHFYDPYTNGKIDPLYLSYSREYTEEEVYDSIEDLYNNVYHHSREEVLKANKLFNLDIDTTKRENRIYNLFMCHASPLSVLTYRSLEAYNITTVRHPYLSLLSILSSLEDRAGYTKEMIKKDISIYCGSARRIWQSDDIVKIFINPWSISVQRNIFDLLEIDFCEQMKNFLILEPEVNKTRTERDREQLINGIAFSKRHELLHSYKKEFLSTGKIIYGEIEEYVDKVINGPLMNVYKRVCDKHGYQCSPAQK